MLPRQKLVEFFKNFPARRYPDKHDLILAGDTPKGVYYIESGSVRQYDINIKNGAEVTTHVFTAGSFFPLTWALAGITNTYFYATIGEVSVHLVPKSQLTFFLLKNPDLLLELSKRLLRSLESASNRLKLLTIGDARQRICNELVFLSRHFAVTSNNRVVMTQRFTHQNIADLTGASRETVSHVLEDLSKDGVISDTKQQITILDSKRLMQFARV